MSKGFAATHMKKDGYPRPLLFFSFLRVPI
jgi:hypothetical protein